MPDKVLIVNSDQGFREELKDALEGYEVIEAASGQEAILFMQRANEIGVILLDMTIQDIPAPDVVSAIRKTDPHVGLILLIEHPSKNVDFQELKEAADDYIEKPPDISALR
ncbi:MAG: response regulator, partial [Candidatus Omnitrophica bacterium]|nr:response regulator [Candidatus Omnitrophota bacterium]